MRSVSFSQLGERWNDFWFAEGRPDALAVFRVLFSICLLLELGTSLSLNRMAIQGGFHLPYLSLIPLLPLSAYRLLHTAQVPFVVMLGLGCFTRPACLALLGLQGYTFFADQLNFRNHPYLFLLVLLLLLPSPCSESLSLRALGRRLAPRKRSRRHNWPLGCQRLIQLQISAVYLFAAIHKLNPQFLGGYVLAHYFGGDLGTGTSLRLLGAVMDRQAIQAWVEWAQAPSHMALPSWITLAAEVFLAFGLWFRRTRLWAVATGLALHLGIALIMDVWTFSIVVLGSYLLFLERLPLLHPRAAQSRSTPTP